MRIQKNATKDGKTSKRKDAVISKLKNNFRKGQKKASKSIGKAEKGSTFAPATAKNAHRNTAGK